MLAALEDWWRTPPALRPVEPVASSFSRSSKTTSVIPRRERWYATEAPIQPPPTITTSAVERTRVQGDLGFLTHDSRIVRSAPRPILTRTQKPQGIPWGERNRPAEFEHEGRMLGAAPDLLFSCEAGGGSHVPTRTRDQKVGKLVPEQQTTPHLLISCSTWPFSAPC